MVKTGPFEKKLASSNVQLYHTISTTVGCFDDSSFPTLNNRIHNPLLLRLRAPRRQIPRNRLIYLNQPRLLINNMKFMLINKLVVARAQLPYRLVMLVQKRDMPMPVAVPGVMVPLEAEQHIPAAPARRLEVGRPDAVDGVPAPNELAVVAEDVRPRLARAVLLRRRVREAREGRDEEVALLDVRGRRDGDVEARRGEVRAGAVLPVRGREGGEERGCGEEGDGMLLHGGWPRNLGASAISVGLPIATNRYIHLGEVHEP